MIFSRSFCIFILTIDMENCDFLKNVTITHVIEKSKGSVNPVIVSFQNGDLNAEQIQDMKVCLTPNEAGNTQVEIVSPRDQVFKEVDFAKPKMRQFIAIHNKKTHKMKIVEVDSALLINSALLQTEGNSNSQDVMDFSTDLSKLNKTFGGKKIVSKLQQREKLNVSSSLIGNDISMVVKDIKTEGEESFSSTVESESIIELLPPCNRNAVKLSDVYLVSDILKDEELEALKLEVFNKGLDKKIENENEYTEYFNYCYQEVKNSREGVENKLAVILFVETLLKFLKTPSKQLSSKKANFCSFSSLIHLKLIKEFCVKTGSTVTRPLSMRDKGLCYIMALSLICCNYEINLKKLAVVASIHLNRLNRLARAVGALPSSKDETMYSLKLPLPPLPKSSIAKTKRK